MLSFWGEGGKMHRHTNLSWFNCTQPRKIASATGTVLLEQLVEVSEQAKGCAFEELYITCDGGAVRKLGLAVTF